ncbi:MAG: hypothetical protein EON61_09780 [Alphaproteobacteria bacterium]|nr:MAG: hypothetical protein EON61_09780 [Alphaproteobacteria bacterium]
MEDFARHRYICGAKREGVMRRSKAERIGVVFAAHAICNACGELVEVVEITRELGETADETAQVFRPAVFRAVLAGDEDEGQTQHLAGALPDQHLHAVFGGGDVAFEPGAVFGVVLEVGDIDRVHHPAITICSQPRMNSRDRPTLSYGNRRRSRMMNSLLMGRSIRRVRAP